MRLNVPPKFPHGFTAEGAPAAPMSAEASLRRSVMSCFLWENGFYTDGEEIGQRVYRLASDVPAPKIAALAIEAREIAKLRHVPLVLLSALAKTGRGCIVADTIERVIRRADELAELLVVHAKLNGVPPNEVKKVLSAQMKKGLARAFCKFNEHRLAKYNRDGAVTLRDVLFLCHAKPKDAEQDALWKRLIARELAIPETWETMLSAGNNKRETFEYLIRENKIGYLALLRNARNCVESGVDRQLLIDAILARKGAQDVLPFRYLAAARAVPSLESAIDTAMLDAIADTPQFPLETVILVDVSESMDDPLSKKSDLSRMDAAACLTSIWQGPARVFTFSDRCVEVPHRMGMAGIDVIVNSQAHSMTYLGAALNAVQNKVQHDRIVVITDEQSHDSVPSPVAKKAYMINVASEKRGVGYGRWTHIDGFSENVLRFISEVENYVDMKENSC